MTKPGKKIAPAAAGPAPKAPETETAKAPETEAEKAPEPEAPKAPETEAAKAPEPEAPEASKSEKESDPTRSRAKEIFDAHDPEKVKELFFTADGTAFFENQFALMHADSLKDQEIKTIKRSEV